MKTKKSINDHIGIIVSCACIIHCLAVPFFLILGSIAFHSVFFALALIISGHAIYHAYKHHCKHIVLFFGIAGILLLGTDLAIEFFSHAGHAHGITHVDAPNFSPHAESHEENPIFAILGGTLLISFHLLNLFSRKKQDCCA